MLLAIIGVCSLLQTSGAVINCRIACRRCRERLEDPDTVEVYCAMCSECKERRREWLQGGPSLGLRADEQQVTDAALMNYEDDCTPPMESCEQPVLLSHQAKTATTAMTTTTTTTTTTTSTTTTTTKRLCYPRHQCVRPAPRPQCMAMPCPVPYVPYAMPLCPMCAPQVNYVATEHVVATTAMNSGLKEVVSSTTASPMFFYVGVPKKMLKDLHLRS